ncbi:MAG: gliding motility-associated C-terminal domain-containing protein [Bacteroidia bacterium]|nr:gliding motility-associated C-terminal domain-containing protein [Bacteroidia bacterium]
MKSILRRTFFLLFLILPGLGIAQPSVVISPANPMVCPGDPVTLTAGGVIATSYLWSTGATTNSITVSPQVPTQYWVQSNFLGNISSDTVIVGIYPQLSGNAGNDTTICTPGVTFWLDAGSYGGSNYVWQPFGIISPMYLVSGSGIYSVIITDFNGCNYYDTVKVAYDLPPTITLSSLPDTICKGDPVTFVVNPAILPNYAFFDNGNLVASGPSPTWTSLSLNPGSNITAVGITAAGCTTAVSATAQTMVFSKPLATVEVDTVCEGNATVFFVNAPAGISIQWSGDANLNGNSAILPFTYPSAGNFAWSCLLSNGICDTLISGTALVEAVPAAPLLHDTLVCQGEDAFLIVLETGGIYTWYDQPLGGFSLFSGNQLYLPALSQDQTYYVSSTLGNCTGPRTQVNAAVSIPPVADFTALPDTGQVMYYPNSTVNLTNLSFGGSQFQWDFGDGTSSNEFEASHFYPEAGFYAVSLIVTNGDGCADTLQKGNFEVRKLERVFVPNAFSPNGDGMNDRFELVVLGYADWDLQIFDRWGNLVFDNGGLGDNFWTGERNGKALTEGVYAFLLVLHDLEGKAYERRGSVTLIR